MDLKQRLPPEEWQKIRKHIQETSIHISDVTPELKTRFVTLSKLRFRGDYFSTLLWLMDCAESFFIKEDEVSNAKIDALAEEVTNLRNEIESLKKSPEKEETKIKTIGGKIIK